MADQNQQQVTPQAQAGVNNVSTPNSADLPGLTSGKHHIYSVRPYTKMMDIGGQQVPRPMWAFNRTPTSRGWHLSHLQLEAAGVIDPRLLHDTDMIVEFFEPGEVLLNGREVTNGGVIVKNFIPEVDKELIREAAKDAIKEQTKGWAAMALAARNPARQQPNNGKGGIGNSAPNADTKAVPGLRAQNQGESDAEYSAYVTQYEAAQFQPAP